MKKYLLFIMPLLISVLVFSCKKKSEDTVCDDVIVNSPSHLKYFGFTLVDTYWDDPLDTVSKTNYVDEVAHFTNVADILVADPFQDIKANLDTMEANKLTAILHLFEILFEHIDTNAPSKTNYDLRNDYQTRWDNFMITNDIINNKTKINAFYIGEEPFWNGVSNNELKLACDYVKSTISDVPIMSIEAYPAVDSAFFPNSIDWVGFDHYTIKDPQNDPIFLNEFNIIKSKRNSQHQKIVLILDSHHIPWLHGTYAGISEIEMKDVAISYYNLAKEKSEVVALLGYTWPGGLDDPNMKGARQLPQVVKDEYVRIGKEITGK